MQQAIRHFWYSLTTVQTEPHPPDARVLWLLNGGALLINSLLWILMPLQYEAVRAAQGITVIWAMNTLLRSLLSVGLAVWILWRRPWHRALPAEQMQGQMMIVVTWTWCCFLLLGMFFESVPSGIALSFLAYFSAIGISLQGIWLIQRGHTQLGAASQIIFLFGQSLNFAARTDEQGLYNPLLVHVLIVIMVTTMAGFFIRWWLALITPIVSLIMILLLNSAFQVTIPQQDMADLIAEVIISTIIGIIVALYARTFGTTLNSIDIRARELNEARTTLEERNQLLVHQANDLHEARRALQHQVLEQEQQIAEALAALRRQSVEISSLQTPLIRIANGVLVIPLIGAWNVARADAFLNNVLTGIAQQRAHAAVLDLTGIDTADEIVVTMLEQVVSAARLLGCTCVLVGIQPEMAQALVSTRRDLAARTAMDLAAGVRWALQRTG